MSVALFVESSFRMETGVNIPGVVPIRTRTPEKKKSVTGMSMSGKQGNYLSLSHLRIPMQEFFLTA